MSGKVEAGINGVSHGAVWAMRYEARSIFPLTGHVRDPGQRFHPQDPGYIDNPILGKNDVND